MEEIISFFNYLMNSEEIIQTGGLLAVLLIVYIENGLFFGFFLPGDYLLFLSGVFVASGLLEVPILVLGVGIFLAAVLGSYTGYITGRFFGDKIRNRRNSFFFSQSYITRTENYFNKYGDRTLIIARFLPVVRTFSPILAGLIKLDVFRFSLYNIVGGAIWTVSLTGSGYFLGHRFPWIIDYVHYIIIFFLAITTVTVVRGYLSAKKDLKDNED